MATPFGHTADGFETQAGTNDPGHFVLVNRIASLIRDGGRLINLSSAGHRFSNVDLEDPNFERTPYDGFVALLLYLHACECHKNTLIVLIRFAISFTE